MLLNSIYTPYCLDNLVKVKKNQADVAKSVEKEVVVKMLAHDPYGKPGAGAPNRDENGELIIFLSCVNSF